MNKLFYAIAIFLLSLNYGYSQDNIITNSERSVIQTGNNSTVNYNVNISLEEIYQILKLREEEQNLDIIERNINNIENLTIELEKHITELELKITPLKESNKRLYVQGKTQITKTKILISELKKFKERFSIKTIYDNLGIKKSILFRDSIQITTNNYLFIGDFVNGLARIKFNNKYGYVNYEGIELIKPQFDVAEDFTSDGFAYVEQIGVGKKIIDLNGRLVKDLTHLKKVNVFEKGYATFQGSNHKFGIINNNGIIVIEPIFEEIKNVDQNNLVRVKYDYNGWGIIDLNTKKITNSLYKFIGDPSEGYYPVKEFKYGHNAGFIDTSGNLKIGCIYLNTFQFRKGIALVQKTQSQYTLVNKLGVELIPETLHSKNINKIQFEYDLDTLYIDHFDIHYKFSLRGDCYYNCEIYKYISNISNKFVKNYTPVKISKVSKKLYEIDLKFESIWHDLHKVIFFDKAGNEIIEGIRSSKFQKDGHCVLIDKDRQYVLIDKNGNRITTQDYLWISDYDGNLRICSKRIPEKEDYSYKTVYSLIFKNGKDAMLEYDGIEEFVNDMAIVFKFGRKYKKKYGFINRLGKEVIPCKYDDATSFDKNGIGVVKKGTRTIKYNSEGKKQRD